MPHCPDPEDMKTIISDSPAQFRAGLAAAAQVKIPGEPFRCVQGAGMGGSAMAFDLIRDARLSRVPIHVHRNYDLPPRLKAKKPLVIASSFSGDTEETLSAYEAARAQKLPLLGIATGGELAGRCKKHRREGVRFVRIPAEPVSMQPRSATGYMFGIVTRVLDRHGLAVKEAVEAVESLAEPLEKFMETAHKQAERLLPGLRQGTPVIYASERYASVARIFKIKINENAKTPAFWNVFAELNHNEMVGWTQRRGPFHIVFLRDGQEDPRIVKRMDLTRELLCEHGVPSAVVEITGQTLLEKLFCTLLVADWASYELALALGVDPTPVEMVEDFKGRLKDL